MARVIGIRAPSVQSKHGCPARPHAHPHMELTPTRLLTEMDETVQPARSRTVSVDRPGDEAKPTITSDATVEIHRNIGRNYPVQLRRIIAGGSSENTSRPLLPFRSPKATTHGTVRIYQTYATSRK